MAKLKKLFLTAMLLLALGPVQAAAAVDSHIVRQVEVLCATGQGLLLRRYTDQQKMQAVLHHLRLAKYAGMAAGDPLAEPGPTCRITVFLSAGRTHVYLLHAEQFLCRDSGPWELAQWQQPLLPLLQAMPSDA